jgi:threonine dehydratase
MHKVAGNPDFAPHADLAKYIKPTTIVEANRLSLHLKSKVLIASEIGQHSGERQHTGSFKFRAAMNVVLSVANQMFITASSGNFAQALALACKLLDRRCLVIMPDTSASVKIEATRGHGAEVELIDTNKISRKERLQELAEQYPDAYIASPFDDPLVIAGNSSLGIELANSGKNFDIVIVPIGGGGLSAGVLMGLKQSERAKNVKVFGAEPQLANDAYRSFNEKVLIANEQEPQTIADGARTLSLGAANWPILRDGLAGIIEVSEEGIEQAVYLLYEHVGIRSEPTGALATGALMNYTRFFQDKTVLCIVSGGNVDESRFQQILAKFARG